MQEGGEINFGLRRVSWLDFLIDGRGHFDAHCFRVLGPGNSGTPTPRPRKRRRHPRRPSASGGEDTSVLLPNRWHGRRRPTGEWIESDHRRGRVGLPFPRCSRLLVVDTRGQLVLTALIYSGRLFICCGHICIHALIKRAPAACCDGGTESRPGGERHVRRPSNRASTVAQNSAAPAHVHV
jgi:hypothetical protein